MKKKLLLLAVACLLGSCAKIGEKETPKDETTPTNETETPKSEDKKEDKKEDDGISRPKAKLTNFHFSFKSGTNKIGIVKKKKTVNKGVDFTSSGDMNVVTTNQGEPELEHNLSDLQYISQEDLDIQVNKCYSVKGYTFLQYIPKEIKESGYYKIKEEEQEEENEKGETQTFDADGNEPQKEEYIEVRPDESIGDFDTKNYYTSDLVQSFVMENASGKFFALDKETNIELIYNEMIKVKGDKNYSSYKVQDNVFKITELNCIGTIGEIFTDKKGFHFAKNNKVNGYDENTKTYFYKDSIYKDSENNAYFLSGNHIYSVDNFVDGEMVKTEIKDDFKYNKLVGLENDSSYIKNGKLYKISNTYIQQIDLETEKKLSMNGYWVFNIDNTLFYVQEYSLAEKWVISTFTVDFDDFDTYRNKSCWTERTYDWFWNTEYDTEKNDLHILDSKYHLVFTETLEISFAGAETHSYTNNLFTYTNYSITSEIITKKVISKENDNFVITDFVEENVSESNEHELQEFVI